MDEIKIEEEIDVTKEDIVKDMAENIVVNIDGDEGEDKEEPSLGSEKEEKTRESEVKETIQSEKDISEEPSKKMAKEVVNNEEVKIDPEEVDKGTSTADGKHIFIIAVIILGVFAFSLGGFKLYDQFTGAAGATVLDVDKLHEMNENGDLDESRGYMYNGFSFVKVDGMWWTKLMYQDMLIKIPLHFGPKEVELVEITGELGEGFNQGEELFIAIDPNVANKFYTLALSEISFNVVKGINRNIVGACTEENEACENRTIINCENAQGRAVIEFEIGGDPEIELKGSCIKIKGEEYGLVRAANRLLYMWYGIME